MLVPVMPEYLVIELLVLAIAIGLWFENRRHFPKKPDPDREPDRE
ncbi:MAG: hypothetical protein U0133_22485 [Gemmatimonadales bacterium]